MTPAELARVHAASQRRWPGVVLSEAALADAILRCAGPDVRSESLHHDDLYLATACARRDAVACSALAAVVRAAIAGTAGRIAGASDVDDVAQIVCERLLVSAGGGEPRITQYNGRSRLESWIRVMAARIAIDQVRRRGAATDLEDAVVSDLASDGGHPELASVVEAHRARFKLAVGVALASLTPRERSILRFTYQQGMTAEAVGVLYGAHRVTVARWLRRIREQLADRIVAELAAGPIELSSMLRLVGSQLSLSLSRLLADAFPRA